MFLTDVTVELYTVVYHRVPNKPSSTIEPSNALSVFSLCFKVTRRPLAHPNNYLFGMSTFPNLTLEDIIDYDCHEIFVYNGVML
jgi:hypothetical protein